ncbi:MAG: aldose epimerase, partial [Bacteroidota bacterium]|nr:aldose epimerase [Bacteroidota bacterium]
QADPQFWPWHSPVLFPVVGRCLNDQIDIAGQKYEMEKHGFARKSNFAVLERSESKLVFSLKHSTETLKIYPYQFEFLIRYHLHQNKLTVSYEVINQDSKDVYFSIGGHPAFAVPFFNAEKYEDYRIEFSESENVSRHYIDGDGFFDGKQEVVLSDSNVLDLKKGMFKDDAIIFKDLKSRKVTIKGNGHEHYLSVDFGGFNYLGLWAKVGAPYVCIEPWLGCADTAGKPTDFAQKEGIISLKPTEEFEVSFTVEVG